MIFHDNSWIIHDTSTFPSLSHHVHINSSRPQGVGAPRGKNLRAIPRVGDHPLVVDLFEAYEANT